jgi:NADH-quinone oxidoreductase subunit J
MDILFWILAFVAVFAALSVVLQPKPMTSALFLVVTMLALALLFLMLHAYLLAALQVIVYAGAVVVLFLFVIMTLNLRAVQERFNRAYVAVAVALTLAFVAGLFYVFGFFFSLPEHHRLPVVKGQFAPDQMASAMGLHMLSKTMFTEYLYAFELVGVLLLVAMVGVVVMAKRGKR